MAGSQSLERGLEILEILDKSSTPLGVREIARRLEISATIVQRLVNSLSSMQYVVQDPGTKRYSIGYRVLGLGWTLMQKDPLIAATQSHLERLATSHLLNGYLGRLHGNRAIYLLSLQSEGPIAIRSVPGSLTWLHSTAMGKVLLAGLHPDEARRLLESEPLPQITPSTVTDVDTLLAQVKQIQLTGVAVANGENIAGVISVGAPVRDGSGRTVAAMSAAYAAWSSPELSVDRVSALVAESAAQVSRTLGYRPAIAG
ncbi:MAG: IclR family transcriptional regulator [Chelatococcus sp.]|uniref:IclR family transcriptional regulator n=1 Tax=Chelatococcus sp. TaxID=1953771 RepID=UPI0025BD856D|nr:IclR family transcriptional regulator [Chelatococcus sp.]MBX3538522.1 IclR family transcriptional regulator [Chelatococcus sp.]